MQLIPPSLCCVYQIYPYFLPPQLELLSPYQPFKYKKVTKTIAAETVPHSGRKKNLNRRFM